MTQKRRQGERRERGSTAWIDEYKDAGHLLRIGKCRKEMNKWGKKEEQNLEKKKERQAGSLMPPLRIHTIKTAKDTGGAIPTITPFSPNDKLDRKKKKREKK